MSGDAISDPMGRVQERVAADVAVEAEVVELFRRGASAILWLLSDEASCAPGTFIDLAGGM